jgi:triphosphatase
LPPELAQAVFRDGPLALRRSGRAQGRAFAVTWLDTAEGSLAAAGLALEQPRRGTRRLLRTLPAPGAPWRPGGGAERLGELRAGAAPDEANGMPLLPIAGFAGSSTRLALAGGVEAILLRGGLRSVVADAPAARLTLSGPCPAVLETIAALADARPVLPARTTLAEQARALARGETPRPRRLGAPVLDPDLGVEAALELALGHLTEVMLWHAPAAAAGETPEGVHQMRVAIRRLRSLLKVFRPACDGPALRDFDAGLKAIASALGPARDWDVFLGGLGAELAAALPEEPRIGALLRAARQRRDAAYAALRPVLEGPPLRRVAWRAVALTETRPWREESDAEAEARRAEPLVTFAAGVLDRRWKRIEKAGPDIAALPDDEFHELRIQGKRIRYAAELFAPLWPRKKGKRFLTRLQEVQEEFGLANDALVARNLMSVLTERGGTALAWAGGVAEGWTLARARRARSRAAKAWHALLSTGPFWDLG